MRRSDGSKQTLKLVKRPDFDGIKAIYEHCMKDIDGEKAKSLAAHLIGLLGTDVCRNTKINDKGVTALASAIYIEYKDSFVEEIKRMGNIIPFAAKKGTPKQCEIFYVRRMAENLGLMDSIEKIKDGLE